MKTLFQIPTKAKLFAIPGREHASSSGTDGENEVVAGMTGSGKSEYLKGRIVEAARGRDCLVYVADGAGEVADAVRDEVVALRRENDLIYDKIERTDVVVGVETLKRSNAFDYAVRQAENDLHLQTFLDIIVRDQNIGEMGPLKGKYLRLAVRCWQYQASPKALDWLPWALTVRSPKFEEMVADCEDSQTAFELGRLKSYTSIQQLDSLLEPSRRALDGLFSSAAFVARVSVHPLDLHWAMSNHKVFIHSGGGSVSHAAFRQIVCSTAINLTRTAQAHVERTGKRLPVKIFLDECNAFGLIREMETRLMAQCRKWGVSWTTAWQHLDIDQ